MFVKQEGDKIVATPRQRKLYRFLELTEKHNGEDAWISAKALAFGVNESDIPMVGGKERYIPLVGRECYMTYKTPEDDKAHNRHDPCSALRNDVEQINRNPEFDRVILCEDNQYKLAQSPEEIDAMLDVIKKKQSYYSSLRSIIEHKKKRNKQGKVVDNDDKPMNERCEQFHNTYGK